MKNLFFQYFLMCLLVVPCGVHAADKEDADETRAQLEVKTKQFFALLEAGDIDSWIKLWDENGVSRYPYASGLVPEVMEGSKAIYEARAGAPDTFESASFPVDDILIDSSARRVVVLFRADNVIAATGEHYRNNYLGIIDFNDEWKVSEYSEYFNPVVLARTFGMMDRLK